MRYAIVQDGIVINIAVGNRQMTADWVLIPAGMPVQIGDAYSAGIFYSTDGEIRYTPETAQLADAFAALIGGIANA